MTVVGVTFGSKGTDGEFYRRARRLARLFIQLGVERDDRIAMLSPARPEFFYVYLATAMAGGIGSGLNPRYTLSELRYLVQDARPRILVAVREYLGRDFKPDLEALLEEYPFVEKALAIGEPWDHDAEHGEAHPAHRPR
jgi:fatty-acyl-CoA synthase/long-chain acyl-CoA synthetase